MLPGYAFQVQAYIDEVMAIIDLMDIMYNLVAGLSVEQRKRLMIGVELVGAADHVPIACWHACTHMPAHTCLLTYACTHMPAHVQ